MNEQTKTILIVDDSPENISVLGEILKPHYRRQIATNGERALQLIEKGPNPDLILLDIMMPGIDGYETCRRLKSNKRTKNIPVIFVTAKSEDTDEELGFSIGAVDYITKPIRPVKLLARIRTQLKLENALNQLREQNKELLAAQRLRKDIENISRHDMRNPLGVVIGMPELLLMDDNNFTKDQKKQIKSIETSGYRLLEMLNRSLDLMKMENGTYLLKPVRVDILKVIKAVYRDLLQNFEQKSVNFEIACTKQLEENPGSLDIYGEELLTYSLMANIIKNALEASPNGNTVTIDIKKPEDNTIITIHNHGVVPEEIRDRFFDKYVTTGKKEGTGLGTYSAPPSYTNTKG